MLGISGVIAYFERTNLQVRATIQGYKDQHTLRWQTKGGAYRLKLPAS